MRKLLLSAAALLLGVTHFAAAQNYDLTNSSVLLPGAAVKTPLSQLFQQAVVDKGISVTATGASCNGSNDDTSALNTYMATMSQGGTIFIPAGSQCVVNSGNLNLPTGVRLVGMSEPRQTAYAPIVVSGVIINPSYTITMQKGSGLYNLMIVRQNLLSNPSSVQAIAAVNQWGSETSTAITIPDNTGGQYLSNLFIVGFNTAIKSYSGNYTMIRIAGDDYNGIEVARAGDNGVIFDARFEPYYSLGTDSGSGAWARPGIAFNFHDGDTLGQSALVGGFSFMYANGVVMNNIGITRVTDSSFEWQSSMGNGLSGTQGIRLTGSCAGCAVNQTYLSGFDTAVSDEVSNVVEFRNLSPIVWNTTTGAAFYLAGASAVSTNLTITGTVTAGATVCAQIAGSGITGSPAQACYTAVTGDNTTRIAQGLVVQIEKTQPLIAARVSASANNNVVTIMWPADQTDTVTPSATGSLSVASASGSVASGSDGTIVAPALTNGTLARAFVVGNTAGDANSWIIDSPFMSNGTSSLTSGWLVWNHPQASSVARVTLTGVQWSAINSTSNLTNCGTAPSFTHGYTTDAHGVVVEGTGATGCRVTFTTPYPWIPTVTITNWNNPSVVLIQDVDATGFTVVNALADNDTFTFDVRP